MHWTVVKQESIDKHICTHVNSNCVECSSNTRQLCILGTRAGRRLLIEEDVHGTDTVYA